MKQLSGWDVSVSCGISCKCIFGDLCPTRDPFSLLKKRLKILEKCSMLYLCVYVQCGVICGYFYLENATVFIFLKETAVGNAVCLITVFSSHLFYSPRWSWFICCKVSPLDALAGEWCFLPRIGSPSAGEAVKWCMFLGVSLVFKT